MPITGIVFEGESAFFLLKYADNGPDVRVPVDEHTWTFDGSRSLADNFIDNTPDDEIPVMETPNSKALEEAEKRIKEERRERRKRKLRKEIEAEMEAEQKKPAHKARRRILVEFSDEEEEKEN
ncbi:hypothetical protein AAVH_26357 [Aphelenchoides avenae]|nr:hypothetical protein AAVH_26357 [Aphelenchus avenae]